jgi:hypothetical protein
MRAVFVFAISLVIVAAGTARAGDAPGQRYERRQIEGWTVYINDRLLDRAHHDLGEETIKLLGDHLYRIARVIPAEPLARLRQVRIWVELDNGFPTAMCYHVDVGWLRENGYNTNKARAVEISSARKFLDWTHTQPWMVLHELAHAYHDQVLGFDNAEVRACYDSARDAKSYESVLHYSGKRRRAYALTNDREYFAEATEAFFGTNDFYPFVRVELRQHDPRICELLERLWGVKKAR